MQQVSRPEHGDRARDDVHREHREHAGCAAREQHVMRRGRTERRENPRAAEPPSAHRRLVRAAQRQTPRRRDARSRQSHQERAQRIEPREGILIQKRNVVCRDEPQRRSTRVRDSIDRAMSPEAPSPHGSRRANLEPLFNRRGDEERIYERRRKVCPDVDLADTQVGRDGAIEKVRRNKPDDAEHEREHHRSRTRRLERTSRQNARVQRRRRKDDKQSDKDLCSEQGSEMNPHDSHRRAGSTVTRPLERE